MNQIAKFKKEKNQLITKSEIESKLDILVNGQTIIRMGELLSWKVYQLETLLEEGWISIDRLKRGPATYKAFLTSEGKRIIKLRKRDFEFLFLMKVLS